MKMQRLKQEVFAVGLWIAIIWFVELGIESVAGDHTSWCVVVPTVTIKKGSSFITKPRYKRGMKSLVSLKFKQLILKLTQE